MGVTATNTYTFYFILFLNLKITWQLYAPERSVHIEYIYVCEYLSVCICMFIIVCICVYGCVCMRVRVCVCVCVSGVCTCMYIYAFMCVHDIYLGTVYAM